MNQKVFKYFLLTFFTVCAFNSNVLATQKPSRPPVLHMIAVHEGEPNKKKFDKYCRKSASETSGTPVTEAPRPRMTQISGECLSVNRYREVKVNVSDKSAPLILALNAYNYVTWIIKADRGVVIKKVILMGYHTQKITGLCNDVPVEAYTYEPSPCPKCWQGNWREDMDYYGKKEPPKELKGISDLPISTFQWRYTGGEFSIYAGMKSVEEDTPKENNPKIKEAEQAQKPTSSLAVSDPKPALDAALRKGVIRKATAEDISAFRDAYIEKKYTKNGLPVPKNEDALSVTDVDVSHAYVVLKKFDYPSGMIKENRVVFFIPKGVPEPSGEYGHSAIYHFDSLTVECSAARTGRFSC